MQYEDYMKICRFLVIDIYHLKSVQIVLFVSKLGIFFLVILQTCEFLSRFEVDYFVQYGPSYFILLYVLTCLLTQPLFTDALKSAAGKIEKNSSQSIVKIVPKKVKKSALFATIFVIWTTTISALMAISLMIPTKDDDNVFFAFNLAKIYLPGWKIVLKNIARCFAFPASYLSASIACLNLLYLFQVGNLNIQKCLLQIKKINATTNQDEIARSLKFLLNSLTTNEGFIREAAKRAEFLVLPLKVMASAAMMSIVVFYFGFEGSLRDQYFRIFGLALIAINAVVGTPAVGQAIEDFMSQVFDALVQVEWCDWNESNKKMYLMLLIASSKPIKIKFSENISVNYEFGVELAKTVFSTISVMERLHTSKSGSF
ncbi:uncharacterized protein LOC135124886 [Zophobas morio]|uniref:uncharacterized protein LOC135124886 n=1 Tax=Zophobas morio TaxID=2755281 RepID=UPI003082BF62